MDRRLLVRLHDHFSKIENPTEDEKSLLSGLTAESSHFQIASVCRADLLNAGFNSTDATDQDMEQLASRMYDSYIESEFDDTLAVNADKYLDLPRIDEDHFVLVEFPEDGVPFERDGIGYPCFNSEDNGARYIPIMDYVEQFQNYPAKGLIFNILQWPESQNYLDHPDTRCEVIMADEKSLADFGSSAVWVSVEVLNSTEPKYAKFLDEIREKFAAEIAEADANSDKWYEVFVADETGETHTEEGGDTFDEVVANFERVADEWGADNTSIDIWGNRDSPDNILLISNKQRHE